MNRRALLIAFLGLVLAGAPGCPPAGGSGGQDALDQVLQRKKLIVAMDPAYDPFEIRQPDGSIAGFDVDLIHELAADLGVEVELKSVSWVSIIPELKGKNVDAVFSGMSVTDERKRTVAFSRPYFQVGQVVIKRKGDERIRSWRDLNKKGMVVATQQGTTGEQAIKDFMPEAEILRFEQVDLGCVALVQKKCDAVVFDHPYLMKYVSTRTGELEGIWEPFTREPIAAAVRQDSPKLVEAIDRTLTRLEQSGKLQQLIARHFPFEGQLQQPPAAPATPADGPLGAATGEGDGASPAGGGE